MTRATMILRSWLILSSTISTTTSSSSSSSSSSLTSDSVVVNAAFALDAKNYPSPPFGISSKQRYQSSTTSIRGGSGDDNNNNNNNDPLLLRVARGDFFRCSKDEDSNAVLVPENFHTPIWIMRQAGRHMKVYRDLIPKYPTFRQRSETPSISYEISLQPYNACKF